MEFLLLDRPEIASFRDAIDTWGARVSKAEAKKFPEEARFPYLGDAFQLQGEARYLHKQELPASRGRLIDRSGQVVDTQYQLVSREEAYGAREGYYGVAPNPFSFFGGYDQRQGAGAGRAGRRQRYPQPSYLPRRRAR